MSTASSADRVLRVGIAVTLLGLAFTVAAILPPVFPGISMPGAMRFLSMLTGVGLAMMVAGLVMGSRTRRTR
jgi:hypothetical protein